jgi:hypothetical protein
VPPETSIDERFALRNPRASTDEQSATGEVHDDGRVARLDYYFRAANLFPKVLSKTEMIMYH